MRNRGFTLVELLVVIAIVGLLATVGIVSLNQARAKARDAKRISHVNQIGKILELYLAAKSKYPAELAGPIDADMSKGTGCISEGKGVEEACSAATTDVILLNPIPLPPNAAVGGTDHYYYYSYTTPAPTAGSANACISNQNCQSYGIQFNLETSLSGITAGTHCYTTTGVLPGGSALCPQ